MKKLLDILNMKKGNANAAKRTPTKGDSTSSSTHTTAEDEDAPQPSESSSDDDENRDCDEHDDNDEFRRRHGNDSNTNTDSGTGTGTAGTGTDTNSNNNVEKNLNSEIESDAIGKSIANEDIRATSVQPSNDACNPPVKPHKNFIPELENYGDEHSDDDEPDCDSDSSSCDSSTLGCKSAPKKMKPSPEATIIPTRSVTITPSVSRKNMRPSDYLPVHLKQLVYHSHEDFFVSSSFDPHLIAELMYEGFLPIAIPRRLIPKLHKQRCVIYPLKVKRENDNGKVTGIRNTASNLTTTSAIHISKNVKKRSKNFTFTINRDFDAVVRGCHEQHGIGWLYEPIVRAFRQINQATCMRSKSNSISAPKPKPKPKPTTPSSASESQSESQNTPAQSNNHRKGQSHAYISAQDNTNSSSLYNTHNDEHKNGHAQNTTYAVNLYSIEVWNSKTGELAAGELGYTYGLIYTSLTGFSVENSAGSVQLAALGQLLYKEGFDMWDLGMKLDYKMNLGAREMNRLDFVDKVRELRGKSRQSNESGNRNKGAPELIECHEEKSCKSIIMED